MITREQLDAMATKLADEGKLMEAGWFSLRAFAIRPDAPEAQLREMRLAFMAGAQHLFASIMVVLDPGEEPSVDDLKRLSLIDAELRNVANELMRWVGR